MAENYTLQAGYTYRQLTNMAKERKIKWVGKNSRFRNF